MTARFHAVTHFRFNFDAVLDDIAAAVRPSRERQLEIRLEVAEGYLANGKAAQDADMVKTGEASVADIRRQLEQIEQERILSAINAETAAAEDFMRRCELDPMADARKLLAALMDRSIGGPDDDELGESPWDTRRDLGV